MSAGTSPRQNGTAPRRGGPGPLVAMVVVAMLAVGGGAFALVWSLTGQHAAPSPAGQTVPASPSARTTTATTAPASPTASASSGTSTVAISSAAASNPAATQVQALTDRYFAAINAHDYTAYSSLLDAGMRQQNPPSKFGSGYATTQDSAEEITAISSTGSGELAATVSFTSHQSPANSANNSACTKWLITLYLLPQGSGYLITTAPPGYHASYQGC